MLREKIFKYVSLVMNDSSFINEFIRFFAKTSKTMIFRDEFIRFDLLFVRTSKTSNLKPLFISRIYRKTQPLLIKLTLTHFNRRSYYSFHMLYLRKYHELVVVKLRKRLVFSRAIVTVTIFVRRAKIKISIYIYVEGKKKGNAVNLKLVYRSIDN